MKKGDIIEGTISAYDFPNKGSFVYEEDGAKGRKVTVKGTLPGQKVRVLVTKKKAGMAEGRVEEVTVRSPYEDILPSCSHTADCGGCTYTTLSYKNQLAIKEELVKNLLDKVLLAPGGNSADYEWEGIFGSPTDTAYRNKMEFTFGDAFKDGPLTLGLHKKGSFHDILDVDGCELVSSEWSSIVRFTRDFFKEREVPYYHRMRHEGILRSLVVRRSRATGEFLVNLVTSTQWEKYGFLNYKEILSDYVKGLCELSAGDGFDDSIAGILYTENDTLGDVVKCDRLEVLYGKDYITEEVLGLTFKISPFSFFQTNTGGCEVLYEKAREYIRKGAEKKRGADETDVAGMLSNGVDSIDELTNAVDNLGVVYDLYSGTGTIAQLMAPVAKKVIGIEIVEEAVVAARENAERNHLANCEFIAGDVLKALDNVTDKPDTIIVDPPRDGINPKALTKILSYGVDNILYISCKPTSLARDLVTINAAGYRVVKACAIDQFPRTANIEACCLLTKTS